MTTTLVRAHHRTIPDKMPDPFQDQIDRLYAKKLAAAQLAAETKAARGWKMPKRYFDVGEFIRSKVSSLWMGRNG